MEHQAQALAMSRNYVEANKILDRLDTLTCGTDTTITEVQILMRRLKRQDERTGRVTPT